jgi:hypothetical protein
VSDRLYQRANIAADNANPDTITETLAGVVADIERSIEVRQGLGPFAVDWDTFRLVVTPYEGGILAVRAQVDVLP